MFMFLLQIGLAFWALRKGWKKWAFAPPAAILVLGWVLSGTLSAIGIEPYYASWLVFLLDLSGIAVLGGMIRRPLNQEQFSAQSQTLPNTTAATQAVETAKQVAIH